MQTLICYDTFWQLNNSNQQNFFGVCWPPLLHIPSSCRSHNFEAAVNGSGRMEGRVLFLGEEAAWRFVLYHVFYKQPAPKSKVLKKGQKKGALNQNCV